MAHTVIATVESSNDTEKSMLNGTEGVGLYHVEQAYLGHAVPPDTDKLLNEMQLTLQATKGHTVRVPLLDIGTDESLPFMKFVAAGRAGPDIRFVAAHERQNSQWAVV